MPRANPLSWLKIMRVSSLTVYPRPHLDPISWVQLLCIISLCLSETKHETESPVSVWTQTCVWGVFLVARTPGGSRVVVVWRTAWVASPHCFSWMRNTRKTIMLRELWNWCEIHSQEKCFPKLSQTWRNFLTNYSLFTMFWRKHSDNLFVTITQSFPSFTIFSSTSLTDPRPELL